MLTEFKKRGVNIMNFRAIILSDVVNVSVIFLRLLRNIGQKNLR